jgi:uncharacterized membrane protein YphA (DoxX/SURF4 family)
MNDKKSGKKTNIALWVAQILLAAFYGMFGFIKATQPIAVLDQMMHGWPSTVPEHLVRFIGICEMAGTIGLMIAIIPALRGIARWATPSAAVGLSLIQLLAIPFHIHRNELQMLPLNAVLLLLALLIVWGRGRKIQFQSRR